MELRTICLALEAGMRTGDWSCIAEGLVMLQDAERRIRDGGK
jgi:hypothetical protein